MCVCRCHTVHAQRFRRQNVLFILLFLTLLFLLLHYVCSKCTVAKIQFTVEFIISVTHHMVSNYIDWVAYEWEDTIIDTQLWNAFDGEIFQQFYEFLWVCVCMCLVWLCILTSMGRWNADLAISSTVECVIRGKIVHWAICAHMYDERYDSETENSIWLMAPGNITATTYTHTHRYERAFTRWVESSRVDSTLLAQTTYSAANTRI